jgi:chemotaxis protein methyltransferase CheR
LNTAATVHPLLLDPHYPSLKRHLIESTGLAYYADKDSDLATRLDTRITQLALDGCAAYLALLKDDAAGEPERRLLIGQLTIGETYFFRHSEQFDGLREVALPDLIDRNQDSRTLRIWSAGCAIGAEPYSLAILLQQHFADRLAGWDIRILGTDINRTFLARATRGEYDERALRTTPDDVKHAWFTPSAGGWTLKPHVKDGVSFQFHNLVEGACPSGITAVDLILCRNVMIYFDSPVIGRILDRFHECLVDGGWLAVGHAESNQELFRAFRAVSVTGATLYQKSGGPPAAPAPQHGWAPPALPAIPCARAPVPDTQRASPPLPDLAAIRRLADGGHWTSAIRACEELLQRDRLNPIVHFYQALIFEQSGNETEAERAVRRALYLDRSFALAHYQLALLLGKAGRRDGAVQSLRNVLALLSPMDPGQRIPDSDGLTVQDLQQLAETHLALWRK